MPTISDGENAGSVRGKLNNSITRTDWCVMVEDVSQLSNLTYTTGSAWTIAEGTQIVTARELFSYVAEASDATDYDVQEGSAKLTVLPGPDGAYNFRAMLPAADATTDDYPKLARLLSKSGGGTGIYISGPQIKFPIGRYYMGQTIDLRKAVTLRGDGGFPGSGWAELRFPADTTGICINRYNTDVDGVIDPTLSAADFSTIEGLYITSVGGTDRTKHGIVMRARGTIRACRISGFPGDGLHIRAAAGEGGDIEGNANYWFVQNVNCTGNKGNGFFCEGADANAGTAINLDCASNGRYGIWDSSFLGNTYIGCHVASNGVALSGGNVTGHSSYVSYGGNRYAAHWNATEAQLVATEPGTNANVWIYDSVGAPHPVIPEWTSGQTEGTYFVAFGYRNDNANATSVFMGCYSEGGAAGNVFQGPCLVLGGQLGTQYAGDRLRVNSSGTITSTSFSTVNGAQEVRSTDGTGFQTWIGTADTFNETWRWKRTTSGGIQLDNANSGSRIPIRFTGNGDTVPWKLSLSDFVHNGVREGVRSAAPTTEFWPTGSYVRNSNVASGQPRGWRCTAGGTPGTWVADSNWP